jgi:hypothetical protein
MQVIGLNLGLKGNGVIGSGAFASYAENGITPNLVGDFTNSLYTKDGKASVAFSDIFTHSRSGGSAATYFDSNGYLATVAGAAPRLDAHVWDDTATAWIKGALIESASSNLVPNSRAAASFTASAYTKTANQSLGIDNAVSMTEFAETAANALHAAGSGLIPTSVTSGLPYTMSGYVKPKGTSRYLQLTNSGTYFGSAQYATFDLISGTVVQATSCVAHIEKMGTTGIYRVGMTAVATGSGINNEIFFIGANTSGAARAASYLGNTANGFFIDQMQFEQSRVMTSPIITTGAALTRSIDAVTIVPANLVYPTGSPLAVSFAMDGLISYAETGTAFSTTGTSADVLFYRWQAGTSAFVNAGLATNNADDYFAATQNNAGVFDEVGVLYTPDPGYYRPFNIAAYHKANGLNSARNGITSTENTTPTVFPNLTTATMQIMQGSGHYRKFRMWGVSIENAGIASAVA